MTLVVKKLDERKVRELKAEAARRGITLSKAVEDAIDLWLNLAKRSFLDEETKVNNSVYKKLKESGKHNELRGKYVVIAGGKLVGAFETLNEAADAIRKTGARKALLFKPGVDDERVEREWLGGSIGQRVV